MAPTNYHLVAAQQEPHKKTKLVSKIVQQEKFTFFNTNILACTSSKQLFCITNTLLGKSKTSPLPSSVPSSLLLQRFWDLFVNKMFNTRDNPNSQTMPLPPVTHTDYLPPCVRIDSSRSVEQDRHQNMRTGPSPVVVRG